MKLDLTDRIRISPNVMHQIVESESVLLDLNSEQYFGLDEVGTRIWQLILENSRLYEVFAVLSEEYEVAPEVLQRDLLELVAALQEAGLVDVCDPGAPDVPAS